MLYGFVDHENIGLETKFMNLARSVKFLQASEYSSTTILKKSLNGHEKSTVQDRSSNLGSRPMFS